MHMEGPEPQISGNAKVIIEFRAGEMAQERAELGGKRVHLCPRRCGDQDQGGGRAQITSPRAQSCAEGRALLICGRLRRSPHHSCPRSVWRRGDTQLRGSAVPWCPQMTFPSYSCHDNRSIDSYRH